MGDALRVGLGKAHGDLELEGVAVDGETLGRERSTACRALPQEGPRGRHRRGHLDGEWDSDFRSPTGIWAQYDPAEYATIEAFRADPVQVWSFYSLRLRVLVEAEPNGGHALARLERAGHVSAVVTQNIDGLHQRAGSRDVTEVHGDPELDVPSVRRRTASPSCSSSWRGAEAPACTECGAIVKPDVVMFGELMPEAAIDRAYELARAAADAGGRVGAGGLAGVAAPRGDAFTWRSGPRSSTRGRRPTTTGRPSNAMALPASR